MATVAQGLDWHQLAGDEQLYCASLALFILFVILIFFLVKLSLSQPTGSRNFLFSFLFFLLNFLPHPTVGQGGE